jgi:multiple sugar transport system permease protein
VSVVRTLDRRALWFWVFTGPFLAGLLVFSYLPLLWSLVLSFCTARNTLTPTRFAGLADYAQVLGDPAFRDSMLTFAGFALVIVPLSYALALLLALGVHRVGAGRAFLRSVFFLPTACSTVAAALIWKMSLFSGVNSGVANTVLRALGIGPVAWLATPHPPWYWLVIVTVRLWLQVGFYLVLLLAGRQRVPAQLYEAAAVDGARPGWQTFRHITWPGLRGTSVAVLLLLLVNAFQAFDEFYNLLSTSRGYPPHARPPLVYLYYVALGQGQDLGVGSAGAVLLMLLILLVTVVQTRWFGLGRREA